MNKVIFKGVESTLIKGLVICELPPITKPNLRIQETIIDGVDGSIIEELGYESYDKQIKIGLKRDADIDEVIEYFNGEGDIVFSNEEDKYYKVKIIDKIDYERLVRFRTAVVTFRTQPFKYLYKETYQKFINPTGILVALNEGNQNSKPIMTIKGTGTVEVKLEGITVFSYTFPQDESEVIIDSEKEDAYLGTVLKNRNMIGEFPIFKKGRNQITVTGAVTELTVIANSRWL